MLSSIVSPKTSRFASLKNPAIVNAIINTLPVLLLPVFGVLDIFAYAVLYRNLKSDCHDISIPNNCHKNEYTYTKNKSRIRVHLQSRLHLYQIRYRIIPRPVLINRQIFSKPFHDSSPSVHTGNPLKIPFLSFSYWGLVLPVTNTAFPEYISRGSRSHCNSVIR